MKQRGAGFSVDWLELPHAKSSKIAIVNPNIDVKSEKDWPSQFSWLADKLEKLHEVFRPRIESLSFPPPS
ncbi:MAG: DUF4268 domain-containing protein [Magnetococcales bacterium]|nr:DUF4268 domain-containing protein [Magnetococcales bacterium]